MDNEKIGLFIAQERKAKQLTQVDFEISCYFLLFHFLTPLELDLPFSGNRRGSMGR